MNIKIFRVYNCSLFQLAEVMFIAKKKTEILKKLQKFWDRGKLGKVLKENNYVFPKI